MTYKTKAERERTLYATFVEAIGHVCAIDQCDKEAAMAQLLSAIIDAEIEVKWADGREITYEVGRPKLLRAVDRAGFWRKEHIVLENGGMVLNDFISTPLEVRREALKAGIIGYQSFLVKRSDIERIWPVAARRSLEPQTPGLGTQPELPVKRPASKADIRHAAIELYQESGTPPNQAKAEQLLMTKFPGTSRTVIRPILQADEFRALRRKPGNQRKR
jgi:hypothetical protein